MQIDLTSTYLLISRLWNWDLCSRSGLRAPRSEIEIRRRVPTSDTKPSGASSGFISNSTKVKESSTVLRTSDNFLDVATTCDATSRRLKTRGRSE